MKQGQFRRIIILAIYETELFSTNRNGDKICMGYQ
jgi:hypothetical protein